MCETNTLDLAHVTLKIGGVDHFEQLVHLNAELDKVVQRFREEYELSYESVIGALQLLSVKLGLEALSEEEDGEDTD